MADNRSANGFIRAEDVLNSVGPRDGRAFGWQIPVRKVNVATPGPSAEKWPKANAHFI